MEGIILTCVVYPLCGAVLFGILCGMAAYRQEKEAKAKRKAEESFDAFRPRINYFKKH